MKMNWGHGLTLAFIAFAGLMIFMTVKSFQQNIDLVTEDYYREELAYQSRIDQIENSKAGNQVEIVEEGKEIYLNFPVTPESGRIHMYRPSDQRLDKLFDLSLAKNETISSQGMVPGYYILKLNWSDQKQEYYQEKGLFIQ